MAILARSKELFYLDLSHTQIGDAGLTHLESLSNLDRLDLSGTRVTDAGLASLTGLSKCRSVSLVGTGVTDKGVAQLSARFPAMRIHQSRVLQSPINSRDVSFGLSRVT